MSAPGKTKKAAAAQPGWIDDVGLIQPAALTFAATLLGAALVVGASHWYLQQENAVLAHVRQARDSAFNKFSQLESEKLDIRQFQPRFIELRDMGLIGEERRLDWIEAIKRSQTERKLLPIAYEIEPQQPFSLDGQVDTGQYQLRGSRMTLHMDLLHEMDLLNLLDDLRQRGHFAVQACRMQRIAMQQGLAEAARLSAGCTLNWFSLGRPGAATAAPARPGGTP